MNKDFRVAVDYFTHPKTIKAERALGPLAPSAFLRLLAHVAVNKPSGVLTGMDNEDIAIAAGWTAEPGDADRLVETWVRIGQLERLEDGTHAIHDWGSHNGYASKAEERSAQSSAAAEKRWASKRKTESDNQKCGQKKSALRSDANSNRPDPSPVPDPEPDPVDRAGAREESTTTTSEALPSENTGERSGLTDDDRALLQEATKGMPFAGEDLPVRLAKQIMARVIGKHRTDPAVHAAWLALPLSMQAKWAHVAMAIARENVEQNGWLSYAAGAIIRALENGSDLLAERAKVTQITEAPSAKKDWFTAWQEGRGTHSDRSWAVYRVQTYFNGAKLPVPDHSEIQRMCDEAGLRATFEHYRKLLHEGWQRRKAAGEG